MILVNDVLLAILNSLWQAALAAGLVWLVLRFSRRINAATRYAIWWVVLGMTLALPVAPRAAAWWRSRPQSSAVVETPVAPSASITPLPASDRPAMVILPEEQAARWPLWLAAAWVLFAAYRLAQVGRSYFYLRGVKKRARLAPAEVAGQSRGVPNRRTRILLSKDIASPMATGFLHPAVILPESLPSELSPAELHHMLLHEGAHLARRDDWANLFEKLLGAALALHPVVWFVLRQIDREREMACDDWVVARIGEAKPYARSLARMSELRWLRRRAEKPRGEALAAGVFGGGSRLGERIEAMLERGCRFPAKASKERVAVSAIALIGCMTIGGLAPRVLRSRRQSRRSRLSPCGDRSGATRWMPGARGPPTGLRPSS